MAPPKTAGALRGTVHGSILNGLVTFTVRALPLPPTIIDFLQMNTASVAEMLSHEQADLDELMDDPESGDLNRALPATEFWAQLENLLSKAGGDWAGAADRTWSFGPKRVGANLLLDPASSGKIRFVQLRTRNRTDHVDYDSANICWHLLMQKANHQIRH